MCFEKIWTSLLSNHTMSHGRAVSSIIIEAVVYTFLNLKSLGNQSYDPDILCSIQHILNIQFRTVPPIGMSLSRQNWSPIFCRRFGSQYFQRILSWNSRVHFTLIYVAQYFYSIVTHLNNAFRFWGTSIPSKTHVFNSLKQIGRWMVRKWLPSPKHQMGVSPEDTFFIYDTK